MKLPDFSTSVQMNENREQMQAPMPQDLSFVKIDERLTASDLEAKAAAAAAPVVNKPPVGNRQVKPGYKPISPDFYVKLAAQSFRENLWRTVVLLQVMILVNVGVGVGILYATGFFEQEYIMEADQRSQKDANSAPRTFRVYKRHYFRVNQ